MLSTLFLPSPLRKKQTDTPSRAPLLDRFIPWRQVNTSVTYHSPLDETSQKPTTPHAKHLANTMIKEEAPFTTQTP